MAIYYAAITSEGRGLVQAIPGVRDPLVTYRLTKRDRDLLGQGLGRLAMVMLEAGADEVYPSFAYKRVDWRAQRAAYRTRAQRARSQDELIAVLVDMLSPLHDLHVWLVDPRGQAVPTFRPSVRANFERGRWESAMRDAGYLAHARDFGEGTVGGYAYLYIGSWKEPVNQDALDLALARMRDAPGLIIDVRSNAGGLIAREATPGRRRRPSSSHHILGNRGSAYLDAELEQLAVEAHALRAGRGHGALLEARDEARRALAAALKGYRMIMASRSASLEQSSIHTQRSIASRSRQF